MKIIAIFHKGTTKLWLTARQRKHKRSKESGLSIHSGEKKDSAVKGKRMQLNCLEKKKKIRHIKFINVFQNVKRNLSTFQMGLIF